MLFDQEESQSSLGLPLRKTAVQMSDCVLLTRASERHPGANDPQPKATASLNDKHRFARPFPFGLQKRQAELVCNLCALRFRSQSGENRFYVSDGQKASCLRLRDKDQPV